MNIGSPKAYTISDGDSMPAEMTTPLQLSPLRLVRVGTKAVDLDFDGGRLSSDAGLVLLRDPDAPLGFTRGLAAVLRRPHIALEAGPSVAAAPLWPNGVDCSRGACAAAPASQELDRHGGV